MIKAVIFDLDGLLIDSEPFWRKAHVEVVGREGHVLTQDDVRQMAGVGTPDVVEHWRKRFGWHPSRNIDIEEEIVLNVLEQIRTAGTAQAGVFKLVELIESKQIPLAVASSSSPDLIQTALDKLGLATKMRVIHSAKHEKKSKPAPDVFISTARMLGVSPANCLVFEDSANGVKAAKAAGMKCIAVPEYPHDPEKFEGADKIVKSLEEVDWRMISSLY